MGRVSAAYRAARWREAERPRHRDARKNSGIRGGSEVLVGTGKIAPKSLPVGNLVRLLLPSTGPLLTELPRTNEHTARTTSSRLIHCLLKHRLTRLAIPNALNPPILFSLMNPQAIYWIPGSMVLIRMALPLLELNL